MLQSGRNPVRVSEAIERYLRAKRDSGLAYATEAGILCAFRRHRNDMLLEEITSVHIVEFLNFRQCSNRRWMMKHSCLRMFLEFWADRGHISSLPMPEPKRRNRDPAATPFIYTQSEVRRLLQTVPANHFHGLCVVGKLTFRTILLTLYGTGAMTGEIFRLKLDELDLKRKMVFLRGNRKILPRTVPLNKDLCEELNDYLRSRERRSVPASQTVFVSKRGEPLQARSISLAFARLRSRSGVVRMEGGFREPRLGDFRQTFAVHRIADWIKEGADLNRMLPALSAYMGFSGLCSIQRFLRLTPERFTHALDELSPYKTRRRWRDDPQLMKFLGNLQNN